MPNFNQKEALNGSVIYCHNIKVNWEKIPVGFDYVLVTPMLILATDFNPFFIDPDTQLTNILDTTEYPSGGRVLLLADNELCAIVKELFVDESKIPEELFGMVTLPIIAHVRPDDVWSDDFFDVNLVCGKS